MAQRDPIALFDTGMEQIAKEIDTKNRNPVWITFTTQDEYFADPPVGYLFPNDVRLHSRGEWTRKVRIDIPVPVNVRSHHINHLVRCIILDGYGLQGFVQHPGREEAVKA